MSGDARSKLFEALSKAQQSARAVEKNKKVTFGQNYKYASGESVIEEAKHALDGHGLAFLPIVYRVTSREHGLVLEARYLLTHASGESLEMESETPIVPGNGRPDDKATATAKTYDLSYQIRGLLLLPRVEEGAEPDARDDSKYEPKRSKPKQAPREAKEPDTTPEDRPKSKLDQWRDGWVSTLGRQLFADTVGCDLAKVDEYVPPKEKPKRDALIATLEAARREVAA